MRQPVIIERHHQKFAVMLSYEEYQRLINLEETEDKILREMATKADSEGFIGIEESEKLLTSLGK